MNRPDTGKTVYFVLDHDAPITPEGAAELAALKDRPIDFSDIPPQVVDDTWFRPAWALAIAERKAAARMLSPSA